MPSDEAELSYQDAALFFLLWQEPGDRALAGWTPFPPAHLPPRDNESLMNWFRHRLTRWAISRPDGPSEIY